MNIIFYVALILVVLIIILKLKGGKTCGPKCQLPQKPRSAPKPKSRKENLEDIRKEIEKSKRPKPNGSAEEEKNGKIKRI